MTSRPLDLILVSTPIGVLGSGRGGGVELTLSSLLKGLLDRGHRLRLIAAEGSQLPPGCDAAELLTAEGEDQPSWQHLDGESPVLIPRGGLLPRFLDIAFEVGARADAVINFGYDWLPLWITPHVPHRLFHLISMGAVAEVMRDQIEALAAWDQHRLAFHTARQAADFSLPDPPRVVGNGFDLTRYRFRHENARLTRLAAAKRLEAQNPTKVFTYYLNLFDAKPSALSVSQSLFAYPISGSWTMGQGRLDDNPQTTEGCSFNFRDGATVGTNWIPGVSGSGGSWFTGSQYEATH